MNHIRRFVWNLLGHAGVAVAAIAKGRGKASSTSTNGHKPLAACQSATANSWTELLHAVFVGPNLFGQVVADRPNKFGPTPYPYTVLAIAAALTGAPAWAQNALPSNALPTAGKITAGQATISQTSNALTVLQQSERTALDWQSFNIGSAATVNFKQPGVSSVALNRIAGNSASEIYGKLNANGQVFFSNANGMLFAKGSQVNVGGILASTLGLGNDDFMAGNYRFTSPGAGSVKNDGTLNALGSVVLMGNSVQNTGQINARSVTLVAGNKLAIDLTNDGLIRARVTDAAGSIEQVVNNSGIIKASGLVNQGGEIVLQGGRTLNAGSLDASSTTGKGGTVKMLGTQVGVTGNGGIDASGATGGGTILVGGDYQGKNPDVQNANVTYVGPGASLKADATAKGDGGKVIVWSDDTTRAYGSISARGGANGGNGGFVETSGHQYLDASGARVDTRAPRGLTGNWLLDPGDITINHSVTPVNATMTVAGASSTISDYDISASLVSTDVMIATSGGSTGSGDITFDASSGAVAINGVNKTLTLQADHDIKFTGGATTFSGAMGVVLSPTGKITTATGSSVTLDGNPGPTRAYVALAKTWENSGTLSLTNDAAFHIEHNYGAGASTFHNMNGGIVNVAAAPTGWAIWSNGCCQDGILINDGVFNITASTSFEAAYSQSSTGALNISDTKFLNLQNAISLSGGVNLNASGILSINENHGTPASLSDLTFSVTGGALNVLGGKTANLSNVTAGNVALAVSGAGVVNIVNGDAVFKSVSLSGGTLGAISNGTLGIASGNFTIPNGVTYVGNVGYYAAGNLNVTNNISAPGSLKLMAGWNPSSGTSVPETTAVTGNIDVATGVTAHGSSLYATAGNDITSTGTGKFTGNVYLKAGGNMALTLDGDFTAETTTNTKSINIKDPGALVTLAQGIKTNNGNVSLNPTGATTSQLNGPVDLGTGELSLHSTATTTYNVASGATIRAGGLVLDATTTLSGVADLMVKTDALTLPSGAGITAVGALTIEPLSSTRNMQIAGTDPTGVLYLSGLTQLSPGTALVLGSDDPSYSGTTTVAGAITTSKDLILRGGGGGVAVAAAGTVNAGSRNIILEADSLTLSSTVTTTGGVSIRPFTSGRPITVGSATCTIANCLPVTNLYNIVAPELAIGSDSSPSPSGALDVVAITNGSTSAITDKNALTTRIGLLSGGNITQSGAITVQDLGISAGGTVTLDVIDVSNAVTNLAGKSTVAFSFTNGQNFNVTTLSGGITPYMYSVSGITTTNSDISLTSSVGDINLSAPLNAGSGTLTMSAAGAINASASTATVTAGIFRLNGGTWNQVAATLPSFTVTDFGITAGTFIRALGGDGIDTPYQLTDIYGVQGMGSTGMLGKSYVLANDIAAAGTLNWNAEDGFMPIGDNSNSFTGTFDGQNHTISNLTINRSNTDYVGLFGATDGASVSKVGLTNVTITGRAHVGGLVGYNNGVVSNAYTSGTVTGTGDYVGGLVGYNDSLGTITNAYSTGNVDGSFDGGINYVGGLVGYNDGSIESAYATGNVSGRNKIGGLVGYNNSGDIKTSYTTGEVVGDSYVGGLVGYNDSGTITNTYAMGSVAGYSSVGGLVGENFGTIINSYSAGAVSGTSSNIGGLVGYDESGGNAGSYWNVETSGRSSSGGNEVGLTTTQMMKLANYNTATAANENVNPDWSIANTGGSNAIWRIYEGHTYPLLRSFLTPLTLANTTVSYNGNARTGGNTAIDGISGAAATGTNAGVYYNSYYSTQQGYDISGGNLTISQAAVVTPPPPPPPPTMNECVANPSLAGCSGAGGVLPPLATCTTTPTAAGCSAVLPPLATCTTTPTAPGCSAVLPPLATCTTTPTAPGCSAVLPPLATCTTTPTAPGCSAVLPPMATCTTTPTAPGCSAVLPPLATCTITPTAPGCSAVLPPLAACTTTPSTAGCSAVLPPLATCTTTPTTTGCSAVLPPLAICTTTPTAPGCSAVLPPMATCTSTPTAPGCSAVLPLLATCTITPTAPGCSAVLPALATCTTTPTAPGCSAVLPPMATCTSTPTAPGCSAVLPPLATCTLTPTAPGCSAVLPPLATCTTTPTAPGCSAVLPSLASCTTTPTAAGCSAVLPSLATCTITPTAPGCSAVLPPLATCTTTPTAPGCSSVLPSLASCTITPTTPGCSAVLPPIATCTITPTAAGCSAVLPSLATCTSTPTAPGCSAVLPPLATCTATPSAEGCAAVLPLISTCIATPTAAGCSVVLPPLASCISAPTLAGCSAVLPPLSTCTATPTAEGCSAVLPTLATCTTNPNVAGCSTVLPPAVTQTVSNQVATATQTVIQTTVVTAPPRAPQTPAPAVAATESNSSDTKPVTSSAATAQAAPAGTSSDNKPEDKPVIKKAAVQTVIVANTTVQKPAEQMVQAAQPTGRTLVCR